MVSSRDEYGHSFLFADIAMKAPAAFMEVAERSADSAELANTNSFPEVGAFLAYHSFESIGGAWCTHLGRTALQFGKLKHFDKLTAFVKEARGFAFEHHASALAIKVGSQRNDFLYPKSDGAGGHITPRMIRNPSEVTRIIAEVRGLFRRVKR